MTKDDIKEQYIELLNEACMGALAGRKIKKYEDYDSLSPLNKKQVVEWITKHLGGLWFKIKFDKLNENIDICLGKKEKIEGKDTDEVAENFINFGKRYLEPVAKEKPAAAPAPAPVVPKPDEEDDKEKDKDKEKESVKKKPGTIRAWIREKRRQIGNWTAGIFGALAVGGLLTGNVIPALVMASVAAVPLAVRGVVYLVRRIRKSDRKSSSRGSLERSTTGKGHEGAGKEKGKGLEDDILKDLFSEDDVKTGDSPTAGEDSPKPIDPTAGDDSPKPTDPTAGEDSPKPTDPTAGEDSPKPTDPTAGEDSPKPTDPTAGEDSPKPTDPTAGEVAPKAISTIADEERDKLLKRVLSDDAADKSSLDALKKKKEAIEEARKKVLEERELEIERVNDEIRRTSSLGLEGLSVEMLTEELEHEKARLEYWKSKSKVKDEKDIDLDVEATEKRIALINERIRSAQNNESMYKIASARLNSLNKQLIAQTKSTRRTTFNIGECRAEIAALNSLLRSLNNSKKATETKIALRDKLKEILEKETDETKKVGLREQISTLEIDIKNGAYSNPTSRLELLSNARDLALRLGDMDAANGYEEEIEKIERTPVFAHSDIDKERWINVRISELQKAQNAANLLAKITGSSNARLIQNYQREIEILQAQLRSMESSDIEFDLGGESEEDDDTLGTK